MSNIVQTSKIIGVHTITQPAVELLLCPFPTHIFIKDQFGLVELFAVPNNGSAHKISVRKPLVPSARKFSYHRLVYDKRTDHDVVPAEFLQEGASSVVSCLAELELLGAPHPEPIFDRVNRRVDSHRIVNKQQSHSKEFGRPTAGPNPGEVQITRFV